MKSESSLCFLSQEDCDYIRHKPVSTRFLVQNGFVDALKYIVGKNELKPADLQYVGVSRKLKMLKFLHKNGKISPKIVSESLAVVKWLPGLKYFHENGYAWSNTISSLLITVEDLAGLQYVVSTGSIRNKRVSDIAASFKHVDCLQFAHQHGFYWHGLTILTAIRYNSVACLKYCFNNDCPLPNRVFSLVGLAINANSFECLCFLLANGYDVTMMDSAFAAEQGNLRILKYLHEHGCPWDESTCSAASYNGNLECLKYAHENGCPWDSTTTRNAYKHHWDCFTYAFDRSCPCDDRILQDIQQHGLDYWKETTQDYWKVIAQIASS